jgi:starch-binding outer membrane protein, SusD/RagB family
MTMKTKYFFLPILLVVFSCNDILEIEPKAQIPSDAALSNGSNVEATLISAYSELVSDNFLGFRTRFYSELLSDNIGLSEVTLSSTDFTGQVALRNSNILNKDIDGVWSAAYRSISRANAVINAIDQNLIKDATTEVSKQKWKAESLFIRGVAHFELMRLFAQPFSNNPTTDLGIPIRIKDLTADEKLPRSTVSQVYDQVILDLTNAAEGLPDQNGNRADKWAAKAFLARVYFNKLDYQNAFTTAGEIIAEGFQLSGDPNTPFRNNGNVAPSGGVLFQVVGGGNSFGGFRPASLQWSLNQSPNGILQALFDRGVNDFRSTVFFTANRYFSLKWDEDIINPPIIRMSEIYLIHAESAVSKPTPDLSVAATSFGIVRGFSDSSFTPVTFANTTVALTTIQAERRVELYFEGDRYHELKRLKSPSFGEVRSGANVIREAKPFNDASWLLKIPVSETSGNPAIIQN